MTATPTNRTARELALQSAAGVIARDPDAIVAVGHPTDYAEDFVPVGLFSGHDEVRNYFAEMFAAVPDFEFTVDRVVADDEAAVLQWHATGTFDGAHFQGIRASGRPIMIRGVDVFEVRDGAVVRNTSYYDGADFARQIGLLPPRDSPADRLLLRVFNAWTWLRRRLVPRGKTQRQLAK